MIDIDIRIDSADVRRLLKRTPGAVSRALRDTIDSVGALILRDLQNYPSPRSGSTYQRTFRLRRSWTKQVSGSGLEVRGIIGSSDDVAPYNRFVQEDAQQARVHQGRWQTIQDVAGDHEAQLQNRFESRVRQELG